MAALSIDKDSTQGGYEVYSSSVEIGAIRTPFACGELLRARRCRWRASAQAAAELDRDQYYSNQEHDQSTTQGHGEEGPDLKKHKLRC